MNAEPNEDTAEVKNAKPKRRRPRVRHVPVLGTPTRRAKINPPGVFRKQERRLLRVRHVKV